MDLFEDISITFEIPFHREWSAQEIRSMEESEFLAATESLEQFCNEVLITETKRGPQLPTVRAQYIHFYTQVARFIRTVHPVVYFNLVNGAGKSSPLYVLEFITAAVHAPYIPYYPVDFMKALFREQAQGYIGDLLHAGEMLVFIYGKIHPVPMFLLSYFSMFLTKRPGETKDFQKYHGQHDGSTTPQILN